MIEAIFFAVFDDKAGPKVLQQVPPGSVSTHAAAPTPGALLSFPAIARDIIPPVRSSNRPLQTVPADAPDYRVLSHAVALESPHYPRNAFLFNFCLVLKQSIDFRSYLPVVDKLASLFRGLEEQEAFLTTEIARCKDPNTGRLYAVCEILLEDLNNYSECMIPIDGTTSTLNIKLFPIYPDPPQVCHSDVPLLTVDFAGLVDDSWDLTMCRVLPHIDGVHNVHKIALLADADVNLVREALRHLLYYGCMILLDSFSFSAVYVSTETFDAFLDDAAMQQECVRYVSEDTLSVAECLELYRAFDGSGQSVRSLVLDHPGLCSRVDVRRLMTFGVIKGFLRRLHHYARLEINEAPLFDEDETSLRPYLDGQTRFDEICCRLACSHGELLARLEDYRTVVEVR